MNPWPYQKIANIYCLLAPVMASSDDQVQHLPANHYETNDFARTWSTQQSLILKVPFSAVVMGLGQNAGASISDPGKLTTSFMGSIMKIPVYR